MGLDAAFFVKSGDIGALRNCDSIHNWVVENCKEIKSNDESAYPVYRLTIRNAKTLLEKVKTIKANPKLVNDILPYAENTDWVDDAIEILEIAIENAGGNFIYYEYSS